MDHTPSQEELDVITTAFDVANDFETWFQEQTRLRQIPREARFVTLMATKVFIEMWLKSTTVTEEQYSNIEDFMYRSIEVKPEAN